METIFCPWEASTLLFYSTNVPYLVYYSHVTAIVAALGIGLLLYFNNPKELISKIFLFFGGLITIWTLLDILLWATNNPATVMFSWSLQVLIEPVAFVTAFYLIYLYFYKKLPSFNINVFIALLLLPLVLLLPTTINLESLLLSSCEAIEGPLAKYYTYFTNLVIIAAISIISIKKIPQQKNDDIRASSFYFSFGLITFLLAFTSGNVISSFTDDWTLSQYGLFGMPFFALLIAYSMVEYKAFNVKIAGAQMLVIILWFLVGSMLLVVRSDTSRIIAFATLLFTILSGHYLVKSVKQEIKQREEIEQLAQNLARVNTRLKELDKQKSEFVSIASHQLRSPLTAIRGYASMILEGSYGPVPDRALESLTRIEDSAKMMALSIEDYLNVSRIEAGNMKYDLNDFNLNDQVNKICDDLRSEALRQSLILINRSNIKSRGIVHADIGKTYQIIHNLINNSIKYTKKGTISVFVRDDEAKKRIYIEITDTGIGMTEKTLHTIFQKFERADGASRVNTSGTGLGLYVALKMAEAMGGTITAHSEGLDKGSRFTIDLPLAM